MLCLPHQETEEKEARSLSKDEKKRKVYEWHRKDYLSLREIAPRLGVSKSTVDNWVKEIERKEKVRSDAV